MPDDVILKRVLKDPITISVLDNLESDEREKIVSQIKLLSNQLEEIADALFTAAQNPTMAKNLKDELKKGRGTEK